MPASTAATSTLVLIHGVGQDRNAWQFVDPACIRHPHVEAYELPGHGRAARLPGMTWPAITDDLMARHDGLLDLVAVGAPRELALNALLHHRRRIRSAVLVCGGNMGESKIKESVREERRLRMEAAVAKGMGAFAAGALQRWFDHAAGQPESPPMTYVRETILKMDPEALADGQYADVRGMPIAAERLAQVTAPVTLIGVRKARPPHAAAGESGAADPELELARAIHRFMPNSRVLECTGTNMIHLSNPGQMRDAINDHLQWVESRQG